MGCCNTDLHSKDGKSTIIAKKLSMRNKKSKEEDDLNELPQDKNRENSILNKEQKKY